ncbi:MAG TPA: FxsA family protein [Planctomycetota bacterium]|nr:FxsA family protein [Planctomycetota bacterium]
MRWIILIVALFIGLPVLELYLLFKLAGATSVWVALAIVIVTGIVGGSFAKQQGAQVLRAVVASIARGELPVDALLDGALVLVGGVMLITPGLITDFVGLLFVLPATRRPLRALLRKKLRSKFALVTHAERQVQDIDFHVR